MHAVVSQAAVEAAPVRFLSVTSFLASCTGRLFFPVCLKRGCLIFVYIAGTYFCLQILHLAPFTVILLENSVFKSLRFRCSWPFKCTMPQPNESSVFTPLESFTTWCSVNKFTSVPCVAFSIRPMTPDCLG